MYKIELDLKIMPTPGPTTRSTPPVPQDTTHTLPINSSTTPPLTTHWDQGPHHHSFPRGAPPASPPEPSGPGPQLGGPPNSLGGPPTCPSISKITKRMVMTLFRTVLQGLVPADPPFPPILRSEARQASPLYVAAKY